MKDPQNHGRNEQCFRFPNKKIVGAACGVTIILASLILFLLSGGFNVPDLVGCNTTNNTTKLDNQTLMDAKQIMANAVQVAPGPCYFYDQI
jgi:hypothetical protein